MGREADATRLSSSGGIGASRSRLLAFRAFALSVGVFGGLLGMEGLARLLLTDFYTCDPAVGWGFEPGQTGIKFDRRLEYAVHARINAAGFHDVDHALAKPPGTVRVVLLGDSMLAGMQVPLERTFARRLEMLLDESSGGAPRFEVVNCATDGFGTAQAWRMYEERCRHYEPDLVLLGFFAINDVMDNYWGARSLNHPVAQKCGRPYYGLNDGRLAPLGASDSAISDPASPLLDRALRRSYLYQLVAPPAGPNGGKPRFRLNDIFLREYSPEQEEAWAVTQGLLLAFDEAVRRSGARFAVLGVPSRLEVDAAHAHGVKNAERLDFTGPRRRLGAFLAERELTHLDLAPGIASAVREGGPPLYFERDMHWTESGNAVASALVARFVTELYSLPSGPEAGPVRPASFPVAPESSSTTGPPACPRC